MQASKFESLAFETLQIVMKNESRIKISKTLRRFLKEESIIARTQNCKTYFKSQLISVAANLNVTIKICLFCYKVIQLFRVTCFIAGQYNTALLWHITGIICWMLGSRISLLP